MKPVRRGTRTVVWLLVWVAAFVVSHMPPPEIAAPLVIPDKILHFSGFTVLGLLTLWRFSDNGRPVPLRTRLLWFGILAAYGLFDECTQPLFGRTFEWMDWVADFCGAVAGMALFLATRRWGLRART